MMRQSYFIEPSTNIEYVYMNNHDDYRLYKLIHRSNSTPTQTSTVNKLLEQYLQESFDTPSRPYPNVVHLCGSSMLAFFSRNTTVSMKNISGLLLARLEAYDNSKYICFLSVLHEHRQKGLGTQLLKEFINEAIRAGNSRVTLHVNTENTNAMSLYVKCGMRCIEFVPGFYFGDRTYATQNAFAMALQMKNVKNSTTVCQSTNAVEISQQEEAIYRQKCPQAFNG